jgi:hypothetical protein
MDCGRFLEQLMAMDDATWKRHASPWSVWTRVAILPLFVLIVWFRGWFGYWVVAPIVILIVWTYFNPRAFPKPLSTDNWASKATFGERVWLNRGAKPIPVHHARFAHVLSGLSGLGLLPMVYGLYVYDPIVSCLGLILVIVCKFWFLDRMVWLYQDTKDGDVEYSSWLY